MRKDNKTIAYIDASNLKFGVKQSKWELDYRAFRSWLRDKFGVQEARLFIGYISEQASLYNHLHHAGYKLSFRPTITNKDGITKGNVDGELILSITKDYYENKLDNAVLVAGDGDYYCVVEFLKEKKIPIKIVSPNKKYLSLLLKRTNIPIIILDDFIQRLGKK